MPANKNALIRYKTIDRCLRNRYRAWTIEDLVEACSDALYDCEGITRGVSLRTVQGDIQMMRSDKLGYNAPIEVYDNKYYRYADPDYSIMELPLTENDIKTMNDAVELLQQFEDFGYFSELGDIVSRLQDTMALAQGAKHRAIDFGVNQNLKGIGYISQLYKCITKKIAITIGYQSFKQREQHQYTISPLLLKQYNNRWFLFCCAKNKLYTLALDRMESVTERPEITYSELSNFNPETYFSDIIGVTRMGYPRRVKFWAKPEQSGYITTKPLHPSQKTLSVAEDGSTLFQIYVEPNYELYSQLMSYGPNIRVESPAKVVKELKHRIQSMQEQYADFESDDKKDKTEKL